MLITQPKIKITESILQSKAAHLLSYLAANLAELYFSDLVMKQLQQLMNIFLGLPAVYAPPPKLVEPLVANWSDYQSPAYQRRKSAIQL